MSIVSPTHAVSVLAEDRRGAGVTELLLRRGQGYNEPRKKKYVPFMYEGGLRIPDVRLGRNHRYEGCPGENSCMSLKLPVLLVIQGS